MEGIQVNSSITILLCWEVVSRVGNPKRSCYITFITFISNDVSFLFIVSEQEIKGTSVIPRSDSLFVGVHDFRILSIDEDCCFLTWPVRSVVILFYQFVILLPYLSNSVHWFSRLDRSGFRSCRFSDSRCWFLRLSCRCFRFVSDCGHFFRLTNSRSWLFRFRCSCCRWFCRRC